MYENLINEKMLDNCENVDDAFELISRLPANSFDPNSNSMIIISNCFSKFVNKVYMENIKNIKSAGQLLLLDLKLNHTVNKFETIVTENRVNSCVYSAKDLTAISRVNQAKRYETIASLKGEQKKSLSEHMLDRLDK